MRYIVERDIMQPNTWVVYAMDNDDVEEVQTLMVTFIGKDAEAWAKSYASQMVECWCCGEAVERELPE